MMIRMGMDLNGSQKLHITGKEDKAFLLSNLVTCQLLKRANMEIKIINKIIFVVVFQTFCGNACGNKFQDLGEFFVF